MQTRNQNIARRLNRGFTLIETIVALGILSITLIGAVSLVSISLKLIKNSRNQTAANALLQKGLSDNTAIANCGCGNGSQDWVYDNTGTLNTPYTDTINNISFTLRVSVDESFTDITASGGVINSANFWKITGTVTWEEDGRNVNAVSTEFVRKSS